MVVVVQLRAEVIFDVLLLYLSRLRDSTLPYWTSAGFRLSSLSSSSIFPVLFPGAHQFSQLVGIIVAFFSLPVLSARVFVGFWVNLLSLGRFQSILAALVLYVNCDLFFFSDLSESESDSRTSYILLHRVGLWLWSPLLWPPSHSQLPVCGRLWQSSDKH